MTVIMIMTELTDIFVDLLEGSSSGPYPMRPCKIDSENWTYFRFHFQRVSFRSLIVELATILDKTQVWPRKSILYVQISQTLPAKYF